MKVKNIFSSRKTKKKKSPDADKLIIPTGSKDGGGNTSGTGPSEAANPKSTAPNVAEDSVILRGKSKRPTKNPESANCRVDEDTKPRAGSATSNGSVKSKSRRPWSFIEQFRRHDRGSSSSSACSSVRTSQVVDDLLSSTPPPGYDVVLRAASSTPRRSNSGAFTLPRTLEPDEIEPASKAETRQNNSVKRRTVDFRFFNFFKRSSSGDSSAQSDNAPSNSGRASFRSKRKGEKTGGGKKRREAGHAKASVTSADSGTDVFRAQGFSDGGETPSAFDEEIIRAAPAGPYDSDSGLNSVDECPEPAPVRLVDKRVPVNGESAFCFARGSPAGTKRQSSSSDTAVTTKTTSIRKYKGRSDPMSNGHSLLRVQMSEGCAHAVSMARSTSGSTDSSSRRSSYASDPRNSTLPEDSVASFDSSAYLGASRARRLHLGGSVPQIPLTVKSQKVHRALSSDTPEKRIGLCAQARCCQSVSNLSAGNGKPNHSIPRSSSDVDDKPRIGRLVPLPSPHQQKLDARSNTLRPPGASYSGEPVPPPSPVLRAIGYPGVVLRRNKNKVTEPRPNSAYVDRRAKHVLSLNVEDMPSYTQMRFDMTKANAFPSLEDVLAVREPGSASKRVNGSNGRAKRRGGTLSNYGQRVSAGFATAASVDDLESLSSSNFGSKQSFSDLFQMDEDEMLNALLAKSHAATHTSSGNLRGQEPSSKRAKAIRKSVVSLANLISPGKPNQKGKLQRSSSFKESGPSTPNGGSSSAAVYSFKPYRPPSNTPNKAKNNRASKLWCEMFEHAGLDDGEIKWQEAIFELYQGERDLVQDLTMAKQTYRDSMVTLKMLTDEEVTLIFGKLGCLLPLHEELLAKLEHARDKDGRTLAVGCIFVEWFPRISAAYRAYCANQSDAKYALDAAVERDARVRDFLQRCLESPFSRKLDLWSYLDLPRTRLVKFPLLLQNVLKRTPARLEEERENLTRGLEIISEIIERVDETTGEQQCRYIRSKLEYLEDKQRSPFIDNSRMMLCSGQLKNNRGTKMHAFLFEEAFVLTRQTTRGNKISYQVYRHPVPLSSLVVDANEGDKMSGSFRGGGILSSEKVKHSFRVRSEELNVSYLLQASEEHDRKQWINAFQDALAKYKAKRPDAAGDPGQSQYSRRRATCSLTAAKKTNARPVLRSASDKSNKSVASSTDRSSIQEESPEDDASTASEDAGSWLRTRGKKTAKSSVSVSDNGKLTAKDRRSSDGKGGKGDAAALKLKDPLGLEDEAPSSLRSGFRGKKSSFSRRISLGKAEGSVVSRTMNGDGTERGRNKCQRSQSLSSSPQIAKPLSVLRKRAAPGILAGKPPIGPGSAPVSRRPRAVLHEARSTPDLSGKNESPATTRGPSTRPALFDVGNDDSAENLRNFSVGSATSAEEQRSLRRRTRSECWAADGETKGDPTEPASDAATRAGPTTLSEDAAGLSLPDNEAKVVEMVLTEFDDVLAGLSDTEERETSEGDRLTAYCEKTIEEDVEIQNLDVEDSMDVVVATVEDRPEASAQSPTDDKHEGIVWEDVAMSGAQPSGNASDDSETGRQSPSSKADEGTQRKSCRNELALGNSERLPNLQASS